MRSIILFVLGIVAITCGVMVLHYMPGFDAWLLTIGVLIVAGGVAIVYIERDILEWLLVAFFGIALTILLFVVGGIEGLVNVFRRAKRDRETICYVLGCIFAFFFGYCLGGALKDYSFIVPAILCGLSAIGSFVIFARLRRSRA